MLPLAAVDEEAYMRRVPARLHASHTVLNTSMLSWMMSDLLRLNTDVWAARWNTTSTSERSAPVKKSPASMPMARSTRMIWYPWSNREAARVLPTKPSLPVIIIFIFIHNLMGEKTICPKKALSLQR